MRLSDLSVRRPVLAMVMSALLIVLGALAFFQLPLRELIRVLPGHVTVSLEVPRLEDLRRKKRLVTDSMEGIEIAAEDHVPEFDDQEIEALRKHIGELSDGYRIPLILLFYENMSYADISAATGVKEGTLKANVHRAKSLLRQKLGKA